MELVGHLRRGAKPLKRTLNEARRDAQNSEIVQQGNELLCQRLLSRSRSGNSSLKSAEMSKKTKNKKKTTQSRNKKQTKYCDLFTLDRTKY